MIACDLIKDEYEVEVEDVYTPLFLIIDSLWQGMVNSTSKRKFTKRWGDKINPKLRLLIFPTSYNGHWSVYVIVDPNSVIEYNKSCCLFHFDSLPGIHDTLSDLPMLIQFLNGNFCETRGFKFTKQNITVMSVGEDAIQEDGVSCALYTMCNVAKCIDAFIMNDDGLYLRDNYFELIRKRDIVDKALVEDLRKYLLYQMESFHVEHVDKK
jgi:hypothetical protein